MSGFPEFIQRLESLASAEWRTTLANRLGEQTLDLVDDCFRDERDPYGSAWDKTKQSHQILQETGALRTSLTDPSSLSTTQDGFTLNSSVPYGAYHQLGTDRLPRRMMVPDDSMGLPASWERVYETATIQLVQETIS